MPRIKSQLTRICGGKVDDATKLAIDHLSLLDYSIVEPQPHGFEQETPGDFCDRLKISRMHFARRRAEKNCPDFEKVTGPNGSLRRMRSNPQLEKFMQPRNKLKKRIALFGAED